MVGILITSEVTVNKKVDYGRLFTNPSNF